MANSFLFANFFQLQNFPTYNRPSQYSYGLMTISLMTQLMNHHIILILIILYIVNHHIILILIILYIVNHIILILIILYIVNHLR